MSDDPLEYAAGYISPLTDKEHAQLGRIAVLWGQIENFVDELLGEVSGLTWNELETLGATNKPMAAKASFLNQIRHRHKDKAIAEKIGDFCALIHETKTARNDAFHGMWGWYGDDKTKTVSVVARRLSQPQTRFRLEQLSALERKLCKCSGLGMELVAPLWGTHRRRLTKYVHHNVEEGAPEWLRQWSTRNHLGDDTLDRNAKAGQLLRLSHLFPRK